MTGIKDVVLLLMALALMVLAAMPVFFGANIITIPMCVLGLAGLLALDKYGDKI